MLKNSSIFINFKTVKKIYLIFVKLGVISSFAKIANTLSFTMPPKWLIRLSGVQINLTPPLREAAMIRFCKENISNPIKMLEVGTWFGEGSTKIWIRHLPPGSDLYLVDSWKPYFSENDRNSVDNIYTRMDLVPFSALVNTMRNVFNFEKQKDLNIYTTRGNSIEFLHSLKDNIFDLIYIDGSHYYEDVVVDIREAKRLVKNGGIVCGDDLEFLPSPSLMEKASHWKASDFHDDFHPGVLLAVGEEFKTVQLEEGFWWSKILK